MGFYVHIKPFPTQYNITPALFLCARVTFAPRARRRNIYTNPRTEKKKRKESKTFVPTAVKTQ